MYNDWIAAFGIGFLGAGHCLGMCGGIASMVNISATSPQKANSSDRIDVQDVTQAPNHSTFIRTLNYNLGRLISYALFGGLMGAAVATLANIISINQGLVWLRVIAALFLILLACYLGRWWMGLHYVERLGLGIWKILAPIRNKVLPIDSPIKALALGSVWGWLPCGLVYSALTWAAASGSFIQGAGIMFSFGLGTLPLMFGVGLGAHKIKPILEKSWFRNLSASILLIYAIYQLNMSWHMLSRIYF